MLSMQDGDVVFLRRLILTLVVLAAAALVWTLADLLLLLFASILVAIALRVIAAPLQRILGLGETGALVAGAALMVSVLGFTLYLFGSQLIREMQGLAERLPQDLGEIAKELRLGSLQDLIKETGSASTVGSVLSRMLSWGTTLIGAVAAVVIVAFGAFYLALSPRLYRDGFMKLVPKPIQPNITAAFDECGEALRRWLGAQLFAAVIVGVATGAGLAFVGLPSALALGLIAGVAEMVPYIGPIASAVPALIIAFSQESSILWWTLVVVVAVQQLENNVLMPLLASRNISIPPALAMFAIVAMGIMFGPLGLLLGFPLSVAFYIIVKRLYVHDALGKPVEELPPSSKQAAE
jgi:predicted PurR-regulated permease PerM